MTKKLTKAKASPTKKANSQSARVSRVKQSSQISKARSGKVSKSAQSSKTKSKKQNSTKSKSQRKIDWKGLAYNNGFGNHVESEAEKGALPVGQNNPQKCPMGLYAE
mmetsp:Transcript_25555/g.34160  ORF Transcript_25555/g.34160 Transcript_25555/m.34160 type:complete len:107 (-) Transcript_25555:1303-1623(-)